MGFEGKKWDPDTLAEILLHETQHGQQAYQQLDALRKGESIIGPGTMYEISGGQGVAPGRITHRGLQDYYMNPQEVDARAAEIGVMGDASREAANMHSMRRMSSSLPQDDDGLEMIKQAEEHGVVGEMFPALAIAAQLNKPAWGRVEELSPLIDQIRALSVDRGRLTPDLDPNFLQRNVDEFVDHSVTENVFKARDRQQNAVQDAWLEVRKYLGI